MAYLKIDFGSEKICRTAIELLDRESPTFKSFEVYIIDGKDDVKIKSRALIEQEKQRSD